MTILPVKILSKNPSPLVCHLIITQCNISNTLIIFHRSVWYYDVISFVYLTSSICNILTTSYCLKHASIKPCISCTYLLLFLTQTTYLYYCKYISFQRQALAWKISFIDSILLIVVISHY